MTRLFSTSLCVLGACACAKVLGVDPGITGAITCSATDDCAPDSVCVSGTCRTACADRSDCGEDARCTDGGCVPVAAVQIPPRAGSGGVAGAAGSVDREVEGTAGQGGIGTNGGGPAEPDGGGQLAGGAPGGGGAGAGGEPLPGGGGAVAGGQPPAAGSPPEGGTDGCDGGVGTTGGATGAAGTGEGCHGGAGPECVTGLQQCVEEGLRTCVNGTWSEPQACEFGCANDKCRGCVSNTKRCNLMAPQTCSEDGTWIDDPGTDCPIACHQGVCTTPPSCSDSPLCADNAWCCQVLPVPGGDFSLSYDRVSPGFSDPLYLRHVSPFMLDRFEVNVGRFVRFVEAYPDSKPTPGSGAHPRIPDDPGWQGDWPLPEDQDALVKVLDDCGSTLSGDSHLPITCVDWYVAFAFCIWDGGRLPTEAEWNFAAAGGAKQRVYPWSDPSTDPTITLDHAVYTTDGANPVTQPDRVGLHPLGDGRWRHADLAGNVMEWTADWYQATPAEGCEAIDCLAISPATGTRVCRGGNFRKPASYVKSSERFAYEPEAVEDDVGFRCARDF